MTFYPSSATELYWNLFFFFFNVSLAILMVVFMVHCQVTPNVGGTINSKGLTGN